MDQQDGCCTAETNKESPCSKSATVVYLNSTSMGRGDDSLGEKLLAVFLGTLGNFTPKVSHLLLVNGGVKLACAGSPVLEHLQNLAAAGIVILSCGTCLNHFVITDRLQAGRVSSMTEIAEVLSSADRVINP